MGAAVAGGSIGISGHHDKSKSTTEESEQSSTEGSEYSYNQEEKIVVPPGTRVKATTTYRMKYEMNYTVKLSSSDLPVDLLSAQNVNEKMNIRIGIDVIYHQ